MKIKGRKEKFQKLNDSSIDIIALAELGLTDKEIAKVLGISSVTLNAYKKKYPEFLNSLKKGKEFADKNVIVSLYQRATGYSHPDVHISNYQGRVTVTPIIKHYPPDTTACIYWLRNRQGWIDKIDMQMPEMPDEPEDFSSMTNQELDDFISRHK